MNAAETIQAAIDKLTGLRDDPDRLSNTPWGEYLGNVYDLSGDLAAECARDEDAALIVTLHRTMDAQLAILTAASVDEYECAQEWAEMGKPHLRGPAKVVPINRAALALAKAILGDDS